MRVLKLGRTIIGSTVFSVTHRGGFVNISVNTGREQDGDYWSYLVRVSTRNAEKRGVIAHIQKQINLTNQPPKFNNEKPDRIKLRALLLEYVEHITLQRA